MTSLQTDVHFWDFRTFIEESGAEFVGAGIVIEKGFQRGGDLLRNKGVRIELLAIIDSMDAQNGITFRE